MIIAIEGADCVGKTTLWRRLYEFPAFDTSSRVRFPRFLSMGAQLWPYAEQVETRDAALFASMYDPERVYVCDRFFAVSGPVYAEAFGRAMPNYRSWRSDIKVVFLDAPLDTLLLRLQRRMESGAPVQVPERPENLIRVVDAYRKFIRETAFDVETLSAVESPDAIFDEVLLIIFEALSVSHR